MKRIVKGNDFTLRIPVMKVVDGERVRFPLPGCTDVAVNLVNAYRRLSLAFTVDVKEDNVLLARVEGDRIGLGSYALEVKGKLFGNGWRSCEYPQFQIVNNNADADYEFGATDEGDNSVEMDTALVILPPTVELSNLISDTNAALEEVKATDKTLTDNEALRVEAEKGRASAESERIKAEESRVQAEKKRESDASAAIEKVNADTSAAIEKVKTDTADAISEVQAKTDTAISDMQSKANSAISDVKLKSDTAFSDLQTKSSDAISELQQRSDAVIRALDEHKTDFDEAEAARIEAEQARVEAETQREETLRANEQQRNDTLKQVKSECETAAGVANTAADSVNTAIKNAEQATTGAEKATVGAETCNVTMNGSTITVTDRNGSQSSIDVIDTDEVVTVKIASSVESISVKGQKINVFLNHDTKTPQQYMTDETGTATFSVHRGEYYEMNFTVYANAQPIAPVGYTAVRADREIDVEYMPYDEETSEKVIATVTKYIEGKGTPWEGKTVQCTYDNKTTEYQTDAKGQAVILVPVGKEYTINVDNEDGYYVKFSNNKRTYTAKVPQRMLAFNMYQFKTGLYCVDANLNEYTIDEWVATGRDAEEVVAIKVADQNLMLNRGTFMMRTSDLRNTSALITRQWCSQNVLFESIATNGNNSNDANYWNGEQSTFLIRQEAQERSLSVPAADYAYNQIFTIGEQDLHGFMMSMGQEYIHISNFGLIREMLRTLYGDDVAEAYYKFMSDIWRWSSVQFSSSSVWVFNSNAYNYGDKIANYRVLPVFAC